MSSAMRGLVWRSWRETRSMAIMFTLGVGIVTGVITLILPQLLEGLNDFILQVPFIRTMISAMMGIDISGGLTTSMLLAVMWTHPTFLALIWAYEIIHCTRFPAGEIDRGTIDVLLGWPVSRRAVYAAESITWLGWGCAITAAALVGYTIASSVLEAGERPMYGRVLMAAANLCALYLAVGGGALLASSIFDRRGRAIGTVFAVLTASFLLNFLAPFWSPADAVSFLGVMEYYQPAVILRDGVFPWMDVTILLIVSAILWTAGLEITARRSITTV